MVSSKCFDRRRSQKHAVMTIRFQALVSYLDVTLPTQVRLSVMGLIMALANAGATRKQRMLVRAELSCCGVDQQIAANLSNATALVDTKSNQDAENGVSLKSLCILYTMLNWKMKW